MRESNLFRERKWEVCVRYEERKRESESNMYRETQREQYIERESQREQTFFALLELLVETWRKRERKRRWGLKGESPAYREREKKILSCAVSCCVVATSGWKKKKLIVPLSVAVRLLLQVVEIIYIFLITYFNDLVGSAFKILRPFQFWGP